MSCTCSIIPLDVLRRLAQDQTLADTVRQALGRTAAIDDVLRRLRQEALDLTIVAHSLVSASTVAAAAAAAGAPAITVYDCHHTHASPGIPVSNPGSAADQSARRAFTEAGEVARLYN